MKKLLLSTALLAATSIPAMAQDADSWFRAEADPTEIHASNLIGMRIYRADAADAEGYQGLQDDWDDIGEVNDVILSRDGTVEAVLVDIGGFLGMGENTVAVDMDALRFVSDDATADDESDYFIVLNAPRESLEGAQPYAMSDSATTDATATDTAADTDAAATDAATDTADTDAAATTDADADVAAADDAATEDDATLDAATGTTATATDDAAATDAETDMAADTTGDAATDAETDVTAADPAVGDRVPLEREGFLAAEEADLTADRLTGAGVYDANDERIGDVAELVLSDDGSTVEAIVIDVGGFLGIGAKPVALNLSDVDVLRAEDGTDIRVYVSATEEELEAMPDYQG